MQKLRERLTRDLSMAPPQPPAHGDSSLTHCHCPQPIQPPKVWWKSWSPGFFIFRGTP